MFSLDDFPGPDGDLGKFNRAIEAGKDKVSGQYHCQEVIDIPPRIYNIEAPVICTSDDKKTAPPALLSRGQARIIYQGDVSNNFPLQLGGVKDNKIGFNGMMLASGLRIDCQARCNGMKVEYTYQSYMERIMVTNSVEIAFKIEDCWSSQFSGLVAQSALGCALYANRFGSGYINMLKVNTLDSTDSSPIVVIKGAGSLLSRLCMEGIWAKNQSIIKLEGPSHLLLVPRFEGIYDARRLIELGAGTSGTLIQNVTVTTNSGEPESVVAITSPCEGVEVDGVRGSKISKAVVDVLAQDVDVNYGRFYVRNANNRYIPSILNPYSDG